MGASRSALRAGLMASNLPPTDLPIDQHQRDTVLRGLADRDEAVVFIDISHTASSNRPGILELDALVPKGPIRRRVFHPLASRTLRAALMEPPCASDWKHSVFMGVQLEARSPTE